MSGSLAYRPDVDGLRAIAVVSVVLCHFGMPGFRGGYVGVDVFFVISGFLITSILLRELANGTYSVAKFYERRARRILPAFFVLALTVTLLSCVLLLPDDLLALGKSLLASSAFSTNILFWQEGGYFAAPSELKPLLHTWSLSVEEQFYLIFPLLLSLGVRRAPARLNAAMLLALSASLALCVWATGRRQFAFYLLPSRAWELLLGALLASAGSQLRFSPSLHRWLGAVGLAAVLSAVLLFSSRTTFPGVAAALPCFGAAAIITSGQERGPVRWLLSRRLPVFLGRISYSLYLWHWPVLVFTKYYSTRAPRGELVAGLCFAAVLLGTLSFRYVETPFRRAAPATVGGASVLWAAAGGLLTIAALGAGLMLSDGWPARVPAPVLAIARTRTDRNRINASCVGRVLSRQVPPSRACTLGADGPAPSFAIWGDSHAAATSGGVAAEARAANRAGVLLSETGCPPLLGVRISRGAGSYEACEQFTESVAAYLEGAPELQRVLLVGRWSLYVMGQVATDTAAAADAEPLLMHPDGHATSADERAALLQVGLERTVARLRRAGKSIFIAEPVPEAAWDVPSTLARVTWFHSAAEPAGPSRTQYAERNYRSLRVIAALADAGVVQRISPQHRLCASGTCIVRRGDDILYADADHVSRSGALFIAPAFRPLFSD